MLKSRADIPIRRSEDGIEYCLVEDIDESVRDSMYSFAERSLALIYINGKEAISVETIAAYGATRRATIGGPVG